MPHRRGSRPATLQRLEQVFRMHPLGQLGYGCWHDQCVHARNLRTPANPGRIISLDQLSHSGLRTIDDSFQPRICLHHTKRHFHTPCDRNRRTRPWGLALWVHHFAFPPYLENKDELSTQQKVQEITQIFPTRYLFGNPYQHRRRATWLLGGARHRPQW